LPLDRRNDPIAGGKPDKQENVRRSASIRVQALSIRFQPSLLTIHYLMTDIDGQPAG
jgi:hypothetical protein